MSSNIVTARFTYGNSTKTRGLYQWDYGQVLKFDGLSLPSAYTVHFANQLLAGNAKTQVGGADGVSIPDEYLTTGLPVYAWVYLHTGESDGETVYSVMIPVTARPRPVEDAPTPVQQGVIDTAIAALNAGVAAAEDAQEAIENMGVTAETLDAGSSAAVTKSVDPETGAVTLAFGIPKGEQGERGPEGPQGIIGMRGLQGFTFKPAVSEEGVISWTVNGPIAVPDSVNIKGPAGQDGSPGQNGQDGYSPTASVSKSGSTATITITDKTGTTTATVSDGSNGTNGQDGAPGVGVPSGGTQGQVLQKKSGTDYDTEWGDEPTVPVTDVQVNGVSVLQDGVANVPIADSSNPGVVKIYSSYGIVIDAGRIAISRAADGEIKGASGQFKPIVPVNQHKSVFYGLAKAAGDSTQSSSSNVVGNYTDSAKSAISQMLNGAVSVSGSTPTITALPGIRYICGEVSTLDITLPASGCVDVVFESGSTATVLTITPPTGQTVKWANGFDPTALEANTTYEINIADGLGVGAAWT